jgi:septum formation topological specificity factor MinE
MGFWDRLLGRRPASSKIAKDRLELVLVHDRSGLSPEYIQLSQSREQNKLVANIPIRRKRIPPPF